MQIQSLIKPSNGKVRNITVHGQTYAFTRDAQGRYTTEVTDDEAIACLLKHADLYRTVAEPVIEAEAFKRLAKVNWVAEPAADVAEAPKKPAKVNRAIESAKDETEASKKPAMSNSESDASGAGKPEGQ
ncbi:hypothetical protein [Chitinimonas sp. BJB300]|uniref:hypothetical protein n=1 Tax=Chitinimonas sp. BJB300 TaxID=1559339 RepID=UPI000C0EE594|nr:hypothetical protein [Chitinimonas sp. BJB300]PHV10182.1 hypothetical protein CSQ89_17550 [Chitinimonas sp. BJB300]TSJ83881.1 hypothetical protein FG002_020350 [Chitinimonas sp. BJB300]